jgi:hypothetical protein
MFGLALFWCYMVFSYQSHFSSTFLRFKVLCPSRIRQHILVITPFFLARAAQVAAIKNLVDKPRI